MIQNEFSYKENFCGIVSVHFELLPINVMIITDICQQIAKLARTAEYTKCISAEGYDCPGYDTKQSDGKVPVMF